MPLDRKVTYTSRPIMAHVRDPTREKFDMPDWFRSTFKFSRRTMIPTVPIPQKCWLIVRQSFKAEEFKYVYDPTCSHAVNIRSYQLAKSQATLLLAERQAAVDLYKQTDELVCDGLAQYKNERFEALATADGLAAHGGCVVMETLAVANDYSFGNQGKPELSMTAILRELACPTPKKDQAQAQTVQTQASTVQTQAQLSSVPPCTPQRVSQSSEAPPTVSRQVDLEDASPPAMYRAESIEKDE